MEETLGKRIVRHRKQLGMTQDQLAERLGVTAQAVSKWENDQSCPDIATLPKLAEIFSTTTDSLLGITRESPVYEAEVVTNKKQSSGVHIQHGKWEFRYDNSRSNSICLACLALLVGTLYLINNILGLGFGLWDLLWPSAMMVFGIRAFIPKFSYVGLGFSLFGGYLLMQKFLAIPFQLNSGIIVSIILLLLGGAVLTNALRKPKTPRFQFQYHGNEGKNTPRHNFECSDEDFEFNAAFGSITQPVELKRLHSGEISTSFGDFTVDLSNIDEIAPDASIEVNTSFGNLLLLVPKRYQVNSSSAASFACVDYSGNHDSQPVGTIKLEANVSFGQVTIQYV